jgi:hypothetical protein
MDICSLEFFLGLFFAIEAAFMTIIGPKVLTKLNFLFKSVNNQIDDKKRSSAPLLMQLIQKIGRWIVIFNRVNDFLSLYTRISLFGGACGVMVLFYSSYCVNTFSNQSKPYFFNIVVTYCLWYTCLKLVYYTGQHIYCSARIKRLCPILEVLAITQADNIENISINK